MGEALCFTANYYWGYRTAIESAKVLRGETGVEICDNTFRNALRAKIVFFHKGCEACLESVEYQRKILVCSNVQRLDHE